MAPSTIQTWLLGGLGLLSVSVVFYFWFWNKPSGVPAIKDKSPEPSKSESKAVAPAKKDTTTKAAKSTPAPAPKKVEPEIVVEDAESDDEEQEEVVEEETPSAWDAEAEARKTKYEDANRLAAKFISGQKYDKAVEKLTEAIDLAPLIPNASKDIMTLYNNRSAMYEKLNAFDKSLSDINVILAMDVHHMKARVRKARIHEAQDKLRLALDEYVYATLLQQRNQEPPSHQPKIDAIAKKLAMTTAPELFKKLRATSVDRALPSKSHCKNFLESYPSVHLWAEHYRGIDRSDLAATVKTLEESSWPEATKELKLRQATLDLVGWDLVHNRFESAFKLLPTIPLPEVPANLPSALDSESPLGYLTPYTDGDRTNEQLLLSLQYEIVGFEKHLRCDLDGAVEAYLAALRAFPNNIDARLKLANVYLEIPDLVSCGAVFADLMNDLDRREAAEADAEQKVMKAWTLLHRVSVAVSRNDKGEYPPTAIADAQKDVDQALAAIEPVKNTVPGKAAAVTGLVRSVHVLVQSKPMVGETVTEEDADLCRQFIAKAKALSPTNEAVIIMEAEILNNEGQSDAALALIEEAERRPDAIVGDCTPHCVKASILLNKAMTVFQNPQSMDEMRRAQDMIQEANSMYQKALELEPKAIEVLNQYAQYCSMMGDVEKAVSLLNTALPLARTRDDVQDLNQMLILNQSQLKAIEIMRASMANE